MSKLKVTMEDGEDTLVVILAGSAALTMDEAIDRLTDEPKASLLSDNDAVQKFLANTGAVISIDTPDSSWVERIEYSAVTREIAFVAENETRQQFPAFFADFLKATKADSAGKLFWEFKRGQR